MLELATGFLGFQCRFASGFGLMSDAIDELTRGWAPGGIRVDGSSVRRVRWYRCCFVEVNEADGLELCLSCFLVEV